MQFSAEITLDDLREYIDFVDARSNEDEEDSRKNEGEENNLDRLLRRVQIWVAILVGPPFFIGIGVHIFRQNDWAQHPLSTTLYATLLFVAFVHWTALIEFWIVQLRSDGDKLELTAVREGLNFGEVRFDLGDNGIGVRFALVRELYAWRVFDRFEEGPNAFYLTFKNSEFVVIPKRAFANDTDRVGFRDFAASRIGDGE